MMIKTRHIYAADKNQFSSHWTRHWFKKKETQTVFLSNLMYVLRQKSVFKDKMMPFVHLLLILRFICCCLVTFVFKNKILTIRLWIAKSLIDNFYVDIFLSLHYIKFSSIDDIFFYLDLDLTPFIPTVMEC